jgi:hypothetical protein
MIMCSAFFGFLHEEGRTKINKWTKRYIIYLSFPNSPKQSHSQCILLPIAAGKEPQCLSYSVTYRTAHLLHKLYSVQLNCTYSNYTQAAATYSAYYCTAHLLYKYCTNSSLRLNCTYSNYTQAAATCSAAQEHSTFTVEILYKLYSLQLNCTYSNYTQAAATCSAVQQHSKFTVQILYKLYSL